MKRVLFVDDEVALLDGLRGRMRPLRSRWEMVFVESGPRAIAELELSPVDVIVADMRMAGMDGAQLLTQVRQRWPGVVRIVMSGYAEEEQSARLLSIAHQYLSKPCDTRVLQNVIERCLLLQDLLAEPELRGIIGRLGHLPSAPRTYSRLQQLVQSSDVSVRKVATLVYEDPAVCAKVLQVVNSSFFRLARRITNIEQAITYLGVNAIRTLVICSEVFSSWRPSQSLPGFEPEALQERAHRVASAACALANNSMRDDALLAGLLHNIGHWILLQESPQRFEQALTLARTAHLPLEEAERRVFGASHAQIGAYLLGLWGLPHSVIEAVAFQHCPQRVGQSCYDVLAILATARKLSGVTREIVPDATDPQDAPIDDNYLTGLGAPFDWSEAQQRVHEVLGASGHE
ncbi:HDOD domain-containing protein [Steroidobacter flavus]|uniref:HDOD domain-containing protein n=1 Tax=Steroidobacter flavus TaxID=1842136 RepID=A0ABV8SMZ7_9GAMM